MDYSTKSYCKRTASLYYYKLYGNTYDVRCRTNEQLFNDYYELLTIIKERENKPYIVKVIDDKSPFVSMVIKYEYKSYYTVKKALEIRGFILKE